MIPGPSYVNISCQFSHTLVPFIAANAMEAALLENSIQRIDRLIETTKQEYHSGCRMPKRKSSRRLNFGSSCELFQKQESIEDRIRSNILAEDELDSKPESETRNTPALANELPDDQLSEPFNLNIENSRCPTCGGPYGATEADFSSLKLISDQSLQILTSSDNSDSTDSRVELYKNILKNLLNEREASIELILEQSEKIVTHEQRLKNFESLLEMELKYKQSLKTVEELETKLHVYELRENIYRQSFCNRTEFDDRNAQSEETANPKTNRFSAAQNVSISTNQMLQIVQQLQKIISEQGSEIRKLRKTFGNLS